MQQINDNAPKDVVKILVANKLDIQEERVVQQREGQALANKYGIPFIEISAKDGENVSTMFMKMG
jgi:GTPase SAR1 family protein